LWKILAACLERVGSPRAGAAPDATPVPGRAWKDLKVMLAEDNPVNRRVGMSILTKAGVQAEIAENGRIAVEMCAAAPYDVIFMDCQMPEMDGYDAARAIRLNEPSGHRTVIIAMTADAMTGARERCMAAGMDDYIAKPVKPADLQSALQKWATATITSA
jgi:CheY-like chemotaxis protein